MRGNDDALLLKILCLNLAHFAVHFSVLPKKEDSDAISAPICVVGFLA